MNKTNSDVLIKTIGAVAEVMGHDLSAGAVHLMATELEQYNELMVLEALRRCARECRHRLTLADIISRIDDGRPGAEAAWAMLPKDEAETAVWTEEAATAYGVAAPLIEIGDLVAARMAFKESYAKQITQAQTNNVPVKWRVSLGHDPGGREGPVRAAIISGKLSYAAGVNLLPHLYADAELMAIDHEKMGALCLIK